MVQETSEYYKKISGTVPQQLRNLWNKAVQSAESSRMDDPTVMDIFGAEEIEANIPPEPESDSGTPGARWLHLALSMEETQYVF